MTWLLLQLCRWLAYLPYPLLRRIGDGAGSLLWIAAKPRRHITLTNLRLCFPDQTPEQHEATGRAHFQAYARSFFDRFILWYQPAHAIERLVQLEGLNHFEPYRGKPVILLAPHFVGIDAGGIRFQIESSFAAMYAKQNNPALNAVMTRGRSRFNNAQMLLRNDGIRPAVRLIKEGTPFYFLPDMDLGERDAVFSPFFNIPAATVTSVARLAKATGAVIIPIVTQMTNTGYIARVLPAWADYPLDDNPAAALYMNRFIEAQVLAMPEQYLWSHRRFKTRPQGEAGFYE